MRSSWPDLRFGEPHRRVVDRHIGDAVDVDVGLVPVVGELLDDDAVLLHPLDELVGAGADRLLAELVAGLLRGLRRDHHAGAVGELRDERRERALEVQADGQRIDDLDLLDRRDLGPPERALHRQMALEGELRRLGIERLAVVELDVRAQLDRHRLAVVGRIMGQRELRHDVELLVDVEELVAQGREDDASDIGAGERRVEHVGILGKSDAERRLRARQSDGCRERRGREERGGEASSHVPLPVLFLTTVSSRKPEGRSGIHRR